MAINQSVLLIHQHAAATEPPVCYELHRKFFFFFLLQKVELWGLLYNSLMRLTVQPLVYTTAQRLRPTSDLVHVA